MDADGDDDGDADGEDGRLGLFGGKGHLSGSSRLGYPTGGLSRFELTPSGSYFMLYRMVDSIPRIVIELNVQRLRARQDTEEIHG